MPCRVWRSCTPARATPCSVCAGNVRLRLVPPKRICRPCGLPIPPIACSADRLGRIQGSCYLALGDSAKAGSILESTARRLQGRHKSKAIILWNLTLAHVRQRDIDQATTVLHRAIDLLEVSRGGGGLNVVSAAVRELRPWRQEPVAQDVQERLLALMTLN